MMLGNSPRVAVQDPSYPVYVDSSVIMGMTGDYNEESTKFGDVQYMSCTPDNSFFPDLTAVSEVYSALFLYTVVSHHIVWHISCTSNLFI